MEQKENRPLRGRSHNPKCFIQAKSKQFERQKQVYSKYLSDKTATMLMASKATGILRANLCRYTAEFRKTGKIYFVGFGICKISKFQAGFYTSNFEIFEQWRAKQN